MVKLWHFCVFFDLQNVHLTVNLKAASSRTTGNHGSLPEIKLDIWPDTPKPLSDFPRFFWEKRGLSIKWYYKMVLMILVAYTRSRLFERDEAARERGSSLWINPANQ